MAAAGLAITISGFLLIGAGALIFYQHRMLHAHVAAEARNTLTALAALHTQSMLERSGVADGDPAIAVLNGTLEQLALNQPNIRAWMVMGPKVLAYQYRMGSIEIEPTRDDIDRMALDSLREVEQFTADGIYRLTVPIVLGSPPADHPRCVVCHGELMGIAAGELIGAYSIAIDWHEEREAFFGGLWGTIIGTLLIAGLTSALGAWQTHRLAGRPLAQMTAAMSALARGELQVRIPEQHRDDEIGAMAKALRVFRTEAVARREAERMVHLLGQTVEQSALMIVITDVTAKIVYVNEAFSRVMGYSAVEILGKNPRMFASGETHRSVYDEMWQYLSEGKVWQGEFLDRRKDGSEVWLASSIVPLTDRDGQITHYVCSQQDVTERRQATERADFLAYYDPLTGLPNRTLFNDRLAVALANAARGGTQVAVVLLNLDNFTAINDTLGHGCGDTLIGAVAERLRTTDTLSRDGGSAARLGGDEFAIILTQVDGSRGAAALAERIQQLFRQPFPVEQTTVRTDASFGIALYPDHGTQAKDLLRRADLALHTAKTNAKGRYQFFDPSMESAVAARVGLEQELAAALAAGELRLAYQPQVDPRAGQVCSFEALLRWNHPARGFVSPSAFIPVAEASQLIDRIGEWVIEQTCRQMASWRDEGATLVPVAVNLSPLQFGDPSLVTRIGDLLARYQIDPALLVLEITESAFSKQSDQLATVMGRLKMQGHQFHLDDFGTGYSSLSYLARYPFSKIKVDRAFIHQIHRSPEKRAIVRAMVTLGHELGMRVSAEGVETADELETALAAGIDEIQGYFFSKPLPPEDAMKFAANFAATGVDTKHKA